jgi:hypothetical protein
MRARRGARFAGVYRPTQHSPGGVGPGNRRRGHVHSKFCSWRHGDQVPNGGWDTIPTLVLPDGRWVQQVAVGRAWRAWFPTVKDREDRRLFAGRAKDDSRQRPQTSPSPGGPGRNRPRNVRSLDELFAVVDAGQDVFDLGDVGFNLPTWDDATAFGNVEDPAHIINRAGLDEDEARVVALLIGLRGVRMTQAETAKRLGAGFSQPTVSRIRKRAFAKYRNAIAIVAKPGERSGPPRRPPTCQVIPDADYLFREVEGGSSRQEFERVLRQGRRSPRKLSCAEAALAERNQQDLAEREAMWESWYTGGDQAAGACVSPGPWPKAFSQRQEEPDRTSVKRAKISASETGLSFEDRVYCRRLGRIVPRDERGWRSLAFEGEQGSESHSCLIIEDGTVVETKMSCRVHIRPLSMEG